MPGFHHAVAGTFGGDGQTVELARQADGEIADVDHFLDFAETFGRDLAGFDRDQPAEFGLCGAQFLAEQPHQFAALWRRHQTPGAERLVRLLDHRCCIRDGDGGKCRDLLACHRAAHDEVAALKTIAGDAQSSKKFSSFRPEVHDGFSFCRSRFAGSPVSAAGPSSG